MRTAAAGLVVGTSDSGAGRPIEAAARRTAHARGIAIAAIEDYAGNYCDVADSQTTVLIAESTLSAELYARRLGARCPPIEVFPPARYDSYRRQSERLRSSTRASWGGTSAKRVLWAGQPESADCLETLRRIAPALRNLDVEVLIKTHPRDPLHLKGDYEELLATFGISVDDVSALSVAASLQLAPQLLITQFSSVAIEAGFFGIPSLHVLFEDVGGRRLQIKKGYSTPTHCRSGAGFVMTTRDHALETMHEALYDEAAREAVIAQFDTVFAIRELIAPRLAARLSEILQ